MRLSFSSAATILRKHQHHLCSTTVARALAIVLVVALATGVWYAQPVATTERATGATAPPSADASAVEQRQAAFESPVTNTGAFLHRISFPVWPGIRDLTPQVALAYSSQGGIGIAGVGWDMPYAAITLNMADGFRPASIAEDVERYAPDVPVERYASNLGMLAIVRDAPDYETSIKTYVFEPHNDLKVIPIADEYDRTSVGGDKAAWLVTTKDGTQYRYGYTNQASLYRDEGEPLTERKVGWFLDQVQDRYGNLMKYYYEHWPNRQTTFRHPVLRAIEYGIPARNPSINERLVVFFDYIESPWKRFSYNLGTRTDFAYLLDRICVYAKAAVQEEVFDGKLGWRLYPQGSPVQGHCLHLTYNFESAAADAYTGRPLLIKVEDVAPDGSKLPAWEMTYNHAGRRWQEVYQGAIDHDLHTAWTPPFNNQVDRALQYATHDVEHMVADVNGDGSVDLIDGKSDGTFNVYPGGTRGFDPYAPPQVWSNPLTHAEAVSISAVEQTFGESSGSACWYEAKFNLGWGGVRNCAPGTSCLGYAQALTQAPDDYWWIFTHDWNELEDSHRPLGAFQFLRSAYYGPYPSYFKENVVSQAETIDELESFGSRAKDKLEHAFDWRTSDCRDWWDKWEIDYCWNVGPAREGMLGADHGCLDFAGGRWFTDGMSRLSYASDLWELRDMNGDGLLDWVFAANIIARTPDGTLRDFAAGANHWYWARGTGTGWAAPEPWRMPPADGAAVGLSGQVDFVHATQTLSTSVSTSGTRPRTANGIGINVGIGVGGFSVSPSVIIGGTSVGVPVSLSGSSVSSAAKIRVSATSGAFTAGGLAIGALNSPHAAMAYQHAGAAIGSVQAAQASGNIAALLPQLSFGFGLTTAGGYTHLTLPIVGDLLAYLDTQSELNSSDLYQGMADLNGDARPDYLSARWDAGATTNRSGQWLFYRNSGAGFENPVLFQFTQAPSAGASLADARTFTYSKQVFDQGPKTLVWGSVEEYRGLVDLNGDGLLDYVEWGWVEDDGAGRKMQLWIVHFNEGNRFGSPTKWTFAGDWDTVHGPPGCSSVDIVPYISQSLFAITYSRQVQGLFDVNGDGLLDYWYEEPYFTEDSGSRCGYVAGSGYTAGTLLGSGDDLRPYVEPFALKGKLLVRLNTGFGFGLPQQWVDNSGLSLSGGLVYLISGDEPVERRSESVLGVGDFDNDGVVEVAVRDRYRDENNDDTDNPDRYDWKLYELSEENVDALTSITNPNGGRLEVTYSPYFEPADGLPGVQWVVASVRITDFDPARLDVTRTYTYERGVYDREHRMFLGFERVYEASGSGYTLSRYYVTKGFQGQRYCREVRDQTGADQTMGGLVAAHTSARKSAIQGMAPRGYQPAIAVGNPRPGAVRPQVPRDGEETAASSRRSALLERSPDASSPYTGPPSKTEPPDTEAEEEATWHNDGPVIPPPASLPSDAGALGQYDPHGAPPIDSGTDWPDPRDRDSTSPGGWWNLDLYGACAPGTSTSVDGIVYYCDDDEITPDMLACGDADDPGRLVHQEFFVWGDSSQVSGIHAPKLRSGVTYLYDKSGANPRITWWSNELDGLGNVVQIEDLGDYAIEGDEHTTTTEYANDLASYLVSFACHQRVAAGRATNPGAVLRETWTGYDGTTAGSCAAPISGSATTVKRALSDTESAIEAFAHNEEGLVWQYTDARGHKTTSVYSQQFPWFKVLETTPVLTVDGPKQLSKAWLYFGVGNDEPSNFGLLWKTIDANGAVTTYAYDGFDRPITVVRPLDTMLAGETHGYQDWDAAAPDRPLRPRSHSAHRLIEFLRYRHETTYVDGWGRVMRSEHTPPDNGAGCGSTSCVVVASEHTFDEDGRVRDARLPYFASAPEGDVRAATTYDLLGRVTSMTGPNGAASVSAYDRAQVSVKDPAGQVSVTELDGRGNTRFLHRYTRGGSAHYATTEYIYDPLGQLTAVVDDAGNRWSFAYDRLGRKTSERDPNSGERRFHYDANGNPTLVADARYATRGQVVHVVYDALNRPALREVREGATVSAGAVSGGQIVEMTMWIYDVDPTSLPEATITACTGHWNARLTRVNHWRSDGAKEHLVSRRDYCYDVRGRVEREHHTIDGKLYPFAYQYNLVDGVVSATYPDGDVLTYSYDDSGRLAALSSAQAGALLAGSWVDADGLPRERRLGSAAIQRFCYEPGAVARRTRRSVTGAAGVQVTCGADNSGDNVIGKLLYDVKYDFGQSDRIASTELAYEDPLLGAVRHVSVYAYDDLHRLMSEAYDSATPTTEYGYDTVGNLTSKDGVTQRYGDPARGVGNAGPNAILATSNGMRFEYDEVGNTTRIDTGAVTYRMTWDASNRVRSVQKAEDAVVRFLYDETGTRVKKIGASETTDYAGLFRASTDKTETVYPGIGVKVTDTTGTRVYFTVADLRASTNLVVDAAGKATQAVSYDPWGSLRVDSHAAGEWSTDYLYNDKERQGAFADGDDVYDYGPRMYFADVGRWLSPDASFADGPNRYAYVRNNPVNLADPTGRAGELVMWSVLSSLCNACAGYFDTASLGLTEWGREAMALEGKIDTESWAYWGAGKATDLVAFGVPGRADIIIEGLTASQTAFASPGRGTKAGGSSLKEQLWRLVLGDPAAAARALARNLPFKHGDIIVKEIMTSQGPVGMEAKVEIVGQTLHLKEFSVFPHGPDIKIGPREVLALRNQLAREYRDMGFETLRITAVRVTGAYKGKRVDIILDLTKEEL